jgi:hypothetical protein
MTAELPPRLLAACDAIDAFNAGDPRVVTVDDHPMAFEQWYAQQVTKWVLELNPQPSEALCIAARGQHVGRWTIPRSDYPMDRGGYLRWREELKRFHAQTVTGMMEKAGYPPLECEKVRDIILKKNFKTNTDAQTLEDALCLVFLESQFEELEQKTPEDKMIEIIRKTWKKMSAQAHEKALDLHMPEHQGELVRKALAKR